MLQDPYQPVMFMAMAALETRAAGGNEKTPGILKKIQTKKTGYGEDSLQASNALMKITGKTVEKEFESKEIVKEEPKEKDKRK